MACGPRIETIIANGQARTLRMLTRADGLGFGFSVVQLAAGAEAMPWYKQHWEANHIISGTGELTDHGAGQSWSWRPAWPAMQGPRTGNACARIRTVSVFCRALAGNEQHDKDRALAAG